MGNNGIIGGLNNIGNIGINNLVPLGGLAFGINLGKIDGNDGKVDNALKHELDISGLILYADSGIISKDGAHILDCPIRLGGIGKA